MASKRLGSPFGESSDSIKKPKLDIPAAKSFCRIADITPQTATHPSTPFISSATEPTTKEATEADKPVTTLPNARRPDGSLFDVWIATEVWHPQHPSSEEKAMTRILGVFTTAKEAIDHAEEHTRALYTVTTNGVRDEPEEEYDRASENMSPESVFERRLEYFRGKWEGEEKEDCEDGGKHWTIRWGDVTEVWVERKGVFDSKDRVGYFTPLPVSDDVEGRDW